MHHTTNFIDSLICRNQVLDDKSLIKQLRARVAELQAELNLAQQVKSIIPSSSKQGSPEHRKSPIREDPGFVDRAECQAVVRRYIRGQVKDTLQLISSPAALRTCFELLRLVVVEERELIKELYEAKEQGEWNAEQLTEMKKKYGVVQAKMRNLDTLRPTPSKYGKQGSSSSTKTKTKKSDSSGDVSQQQQRSALQEKHDASAAKLEKARMVTQQKLVQLIMAEDDTGLFLTRRLFC